MDPHDAQNLRARGREVHWFREFGKELAPVSALVVLAFAKVEDARRLHAGEHDEIVEDVTIRLGPNLEELGVLGALLAD